MWKKQKEIVPEITRIEIMPHQKNYLFEVISKNIVDKTVKNEEEILWYVSEEEALSDGVWQANIGYIEDIIPKEIEYVYRCEYEKDDKINVKNAKRFDFGVIRGLKDSNIGEVEYMFPIEGNMDKMTSLLCYSYVTHGCIDKDLFKTIKKSKHWKKKLAFIARMELYLEIMSIKI